jgi:hypothetical protein
MPLGAVSAHRELVEFLEALSEPLSAEDEAKLRQLRDASLREGAEQAREWQRQQLRRQSAPVGFRGLLEATPEPQAPKRARQRSPDQLPLDKIEHLQVKLAERRAAGNPHRGPLTLERIADKVDLERHRVSQAVQLLEMGWELTRSDPDFSAAPGFVCWPTVAKMKRLQGT